MRAQFFNIHHRKTILLLCSIFTGVLIHCTPQDSLQQPNIIILLADDMGYGDLTCYGGQAVYTPHIDALAAQGMRMTHFYAGSAVCTPSRAALLTGRHPLRFDIRQHFTDNEEHLPEGTVTLPKLLKEAGYQTAHIGKWHLGGLREMDFTARAQGRPANPGPLQHGFDHSLTSIEGDPPRPELIKERKLYREGGKHMVRNDQRAPAIDKFWTDIKVDEAITLIQAYHKNRQPFYINLWFDVPHTPYEPAPEPHLSKYKNMGATGDQLYFRSMVSNLDAQIGRLVETLKTLDLFDNTLIIFSSDNGAAWEGDVGPFKGGKTDLHEGGIRVPMFAVWKDRISANQVSFEDGHMTDLLPTICQAAGISTDALELDGLSLLDHLTTGEPVKNRDVLLWQMDLYTHMQRHYPKPKPYATAIVKKGKWKLLADGDKPVELFDLENDYREMNNLLGHYPEVEKELLDELKTFLQEPRKSWK